MLDVIEKIQKAEGEAEEIRRKAQQEAAALTAKAQKDGRQAEGLLAEGRGAAAAESSTVRQEAASRLDAAANIIVERIVGGI